MAEAQVTESLSTFHTAKCLEGLDAIAKNRLDGPAEWYSGKAAELQAWHAI